jgi:hypothetical protein
MKICFLGKPWVCQGRDEEGEGGGGREKGEGRGVRGREGEEEDVLLLSNPNYRVEVVGCAFVK